MPLFFKEDIDDETKLAIWKIEESEEFFLKYVPLQREITHPHKRLQHLAGRYLLKFLFPDFPVNLILIADTRKPFLAEEAYHFSISHCGDFASVIVSKSRRVGVDIELVSEKISSIQHKFLSEEEAAMFKKMNVAEKEISISNRQLTQIWSCKEAVFKWYGSGEVDFKKHIVIEKIKQTSGNAFSLEVCLKKNTKEMLTLETCFFDRLMLSYLVT